MYRRANGNHDAHSLLMARPFALRLSRAVPAHVRGIAWMLLSVTAFTGVLIIGRHVT